LELEADDLMSNLVRGITYDAERLREVMRRREQLKQLLKE
jgi:hypothetical protein